MNHKYSTVFLALLILFFIIGNAIGYLTSDEIDGGFNCSDNSILYKYNQTTGWTCGNLLDSNVFNFTVNNITNIYNNYSLYANQSNYINWSGVLNQPTINTYSAGLGLNLTGTTFNINETWLSENVGGNPFNQSLNTTDVVRFKALNITGNSNLGAFQNESFIYNKGTGSSIFGYQQEYDLVPGVVRAYSFIESNGLGSLAGGFSKAKIFGVVGLNSSGNGSLVWGSTGGTYNILGNGEGSLTGGLASTGGNIVNDGSGAITWGVGDQYTNHAGGVNFGTGNKVNNSGIGGIAMGAQNSVQESYGVSLGFSNHILPGGTFGDLALGYANRVSSSYSYAIGSENVAMHTRTLVLGINQNSTDTSQVTIGNKARFLRFPKDSSTPYFNGTLNVTGNLTVGGNLIVAGCVVYNGGTLGTCV